METILRIAQRHNIKVIEDACQAHGATYHGRNLGTLGHVAAFSFYCSKNLGAYGEAGMVVTGNEELAGRIAELRNHGGIERYKHRITGTNSRLDEIQAAILRVKLPHLDAWNEARRQIARAYSEGLSGLDGITLPFQESDRTHVFHLYVIRVPDRNQLMQHLRERGIASGIHYPVPIHLQAACRDLGYEEGSLPHTEKCANEILSLPLFPEMSLSEVAYVVNAVREFTLHQRSLVPSVKSEVGL
jgi:dTDP-4-amino-4,6-dideoxygalactose transaminase